MLHTIFNFIGLQWPADAFGIIWISLIVLTIPTCVILYIFGKIDGEITAFSIIGAIALPMTLVILPLAMIALSVNGIAKLREHIAYKKQRKIYLEEQKKLEQQRKEEQLERDFKDVIDLIYSP